MLDLGEDFSQVPAARENSAIKPVPDNPGLLVMVAQQDQGLRRLDEARTCFERGVQAAPNLIDARISRSLV